MKFIDYYEVLQVSPTASLLIIKVAYRQLSKIYHPDIFADGDEKFIIIKEAYEILSDTYRRSEYDEFRRLHLNEKKFNENIKKVNRTQRESTNLISKRNNLPLLIERWIIVGVSILTISVMIFIYIVGNVEDDIAFYAADYTTSEIYDISLPKEEYLKIKTTDHILNYGEAYFDIYNGTNLTITSITIQINVKNDDGVIIDKRQFQKDVNIDPLSIETEINITTGIEGLPAIGVNDLHIQSKYISWSYIDIIGDDLE